MLPREVSNTSGARTSKCSLPTNCGHKRPAIAAVTPQNGFASPDSFWMWRGHLFVGLLLLDPLLVGEADGVTTKPVLGRVLHFKLVVVLRALRLWRLNLHRNVEEPVLRKRGSRDDKHDSGTSA